LSITTIFSIPASFASIAAVAEDAYGENSKNTADVTITANSGDCEGCDNGDVKVIAVKGGKAEMFGLWGGVYGVRP